MSEPVQYCLVGLHLGPTDRVYVERHGPGYTLGVEDEDGRKKQEVTFSKEVVYALTRSVTGLTFEEDSPLEVQIGDDAAIELDESKQQLVVRSKGIDFRLSVCPERLRAFRQAVDALQPKS